MSDQPNRPPMKPSLMDVMSMWMYAEPVAGSQKRPNLRVKVMGNVPRITVKTNVEGDKNNGRIDFNTDLATFTVILNTIRKLAEGTAEKTSYQWEYVDHIFVQGKRSDKPVVQATCKVGIDQQSGRIYIAVLAYGDRPKIQFFFGPSKFHTFKYGDGSDVTPAEQSAAYALGFANEMAQVVPILLAIEFNPDAKNVAKAPVPGQGGFGGGQRQGGGGGGYNRGNQGGGGGGQRDTPPAGPVGDFSDEFGDWT